MNENTLLQLMRGHTPALLVEAVPGKYPPLGLMKIAAYLRERNKFFTIVRGRYRLEEASKFGLVLIAAGEFSYDHAEIMKTITFYSNAYPHCQIVVGGVYATIGPFKDDEFPNVSYYRGYLPVLDTFTPAYDLWGWSKWSYVFTTRGCPRSCDFCYVKSLEPDFYTVDGWQKQIHPEGSNIMVHDNNIWAFGTKWFAQVCSYLRSAGQPVVFDNGFDCRINERENYNVLEMLHNKNLLLPTSIRFAWDGIQENDHIQRAIERVVKFYPSHWIMVYILTGWKDCGFDRAFSRAYKMAEMGVRPVIQRYVPLDWTRSPTEFTRYGDANPVGILALEHYFNSVLKYPSKLSKGEHMNNIRKIEEQWYDAAIETETGK